MHAETAVSNSLTTEPERASPAVFHSNQQTKANKCQFLVSARSVF